MFEFFALLIALVAFLFARKALDQAAMLRARLDAIEAAAWQAKPVTPAPREAHEQTLAAASPGVGSSRVDLQACKLEYSIVSPK